MRTCRFCKKDRSGVRMFKYAARHWAHYECWLEAKGKEIPEPWIYQGIMAMLQVGLHGWQLRDFPVFKLADWMERHKTICPGRTWTDRACWMLKTTINLNEDRKVTV